MVGHSQSAETNVKSPLVLCCKDRKFPDALNCADRVDRVSKGHMELQYIYLISAR